ncbi:MAG: IS1595 family transposase ISNwi1 [Syntrophorhabdaceae bacterium]|nr:IS1595 family transposase ISNwi1 [Syntrophorhabdaceae bacterium]
MNLIEIGKLSENEARQYIEKIRWPNGVECPHCGNTKKIYALSGKSTRPGLYKCGACRKQFTVTVGTVMHRSRLTMKQWLIAFHQMCASKKGISALQLQRELGIKQYKSAWFQTHRIRCAMEETPFKEALSGTVEVDETYVGGKNRPDSRRGRGTEKTPVVALVSRKGKAFSKPVERVNAEQLKGAIREMVDEKSRIITDEWRAYQGIGNEFAGGHETVNHGEKEYARGDVHTNTVESYFSLLKRGVMGAFHHISKYHLPRYCNEFSFRWNNRDVDDGQRTEVAIRGIKGKRLVYKTKLA